MRQITALVLLAGALVLGPRAEAAQQRAVAQLRTETWHWQALMGHPRTPRTAGSGSLAFWRAQAARVRRAAQRPPHLREWLCIHRHEGSWRARTGNGYYGGLQMDVAFQRTYGRPLLVRKGTADRWSALEQMWVAERAHRSGRGFWPWPNTARMCDLI